ncbi:MAG: aminotransferase class III-fold pyridoxal phosphate-dependent enzyme [Anaerolineales bacterium]|nr:aminotransferase class III-fold pyridoxal phosphate-dependent enzyme [Anaerolineales bacterium]
MSKNKSTQLGKYSYSEEDLEAGRRALIRGWSSGAEPVQMIFTRAKGALVWDSTGKEYIDCTSQAWSNNIGASDERVLEAAWSQMQELTHLRSNYDSVPLLLLSKELAESAPGKLNRVGYCLHGSMAVEMAVKIAVKNRPNSGPLVTLYDGYHGRSLATMGWSWPHINNDFNNLLPPVVRIQHPYVYRYALPGEKPAEMAKRCADILRDTIRLGTNGKPPAFLMEPVQGNGTQLEFPREYYHLVRDICTEENVLLIWDEIQTGMGRCGTMWASEYYGVEPDIIVFGKGVGGGFPLAGIIAREDLIGFEPGDDALTFGQFPVSLATGLAALHVLKDDKLLENCREMGAFATQRLYELEKHHPLIGDIRGPGLNIGIELVRDRKTKEPAAHEALEVYSRGLDQGVIFGTTRYGGIGNVVKIKPPLCINKDQMNCVIEVFDQILKEIEEKR